MTDNYNRLEAEVAVRIRESGSYRGDLINVKIATTINAHEATVDEAIADLVQSVAERVGAQTQELFGDEETDTPPPDAANGSGHN